MTTHNRRRALLAGGAGVAALATGGLWLAGRGSAQPAPAALWHDAPVKPGGPVPAQPGPPGLELPDQLTADSADRLVKITTSGWYSWALLDRGTGTIVGSRNLAETNMTASMIKAWLAADYLRHAAEAGRKPSAARFDEIRRMIRDSANEPASALWNELGGSGTITRMIEICGLTDSSTGADWSHVRLSARDTCRIAHAIGAGKAAGPTWTGYLVTEMRAVRGDGDFGIRKAFPTAQRPTIAIKNGWTRRDETREWNINCLALAENWTMAVLTRYPWGQPQSHGEAIAQSVAAQLRPLTPLL